MTSRPIAEFSRFEAMDLLKAIKDAAHDGKSEKANYYRLTCETLFSKLHACSDVQFHEYLLPLLGDKDQEKILDIMMKVDKHNRKCQDRGSSRPQQDEAPAPYRSVRCYYCQRFGHTKSTYFNLAVAHSSSVNGGGSGTGKQ